MPKSAVFVDLDRTLLAHASGQVLNHALVEEGVLPEGRSLPGDKVLYAINNRLGENLFSMGLVRAAARVARGWEQAQVQAAGRRAVAALSELVAPFAPQRLAEFRAEGHRLVLSTTTPVDMIAPFAEAFGFDDLIATAYEVREGRYTGRLYEGFVWGTGKLRAVREWADDHGIDLDDCHACSDSIFDVPLLSSVGTPHAVNPDPSLLVVASARRWSVEYWDRPPGVPSVVGLEPYHMLRPFVRSLSFPYARFDIAGIENVPARGPVLLASNHRSYFDVAALALVARAIGRPVRFLGKKEIFDAPVVGWIARAIGGIPVDRGSGSGQPLREAEAALKAGEVVIVLPQGTIPRGYDFFDPHIARQDRHGAPGRVDGGARRPRRALGHRRRVAAFGPHAGLHLGAAPPQDHGAGGQARAVVADGRACGHRGDHGRPSPRCCPPASRERHEPTPEELARTKPPKS